ncbi:MAG TPA: glycosyltransferase family 4 protein [Bryobacteraceae bacterium]|nr:glycosyltransferase family 4 protein [Bryobacteraceae bacterium]
MSRQLTILLSAYACEPGRGSEPGVGWNWARHLSREHEVWVITRANNRAPIEAALRREPLPNAHFVYFDLPRWARFWKRGSFGLRTYYYVWQAGALFTARRLSRRVSFDLVHHVTFVKYWMPSFLALLGPPFIWGPVGGGESTPRAFRSAYSLRGRIYEAARGIARALGSADPFVALTARRAAIGFATTADTAARMRALGCRDVRVLPEAALSNEDLAELGRPREPRPGPVRIVSLGGLLHLKAYDLSLRAFARFINDGGAGEYWLVGDGPERRRLEALAASLGVADRVRFCGMMPRPQAIDLLRQADILAHPSLHDSGGWTCLEGMAAGKPVVCMECGGPAEQVTPETGIRVPPNTPEQAVADLAVAFETLALNPELRARMGEAGRARVLRDFCWSTRPARLLALCGDASREGVRQ